MDTEKRVKPVIDPANVSAQSEGIHWREILVRLPASATLADLNDEAIWKKVQGSHMTALRRLDRVHICAFDESWIADAIVSGATGVGVTLAGIRKTDLPPRTQKLYEDDQYRVAWVGTGYVVERKKDGQRMTQPVVSVAQAERDLRNIYAKAA